jgi:hypothetical protein
VTLSASVAPAAASRLSASSRFIVTSEPVSTTSLPANERSVFVFAIVVGDILLLVVASVNRIRFGGARFFRARLDGQPERWTRFSAFSDDVSSHLRLGDENCRRRIIDLRE